MRTIEKLQERIEQLEKDKRSLMNRCFVQSRGLLCTFCEFEGECDNRKEFEAPKKSETEVIVLTKAGEQE